MVALNFNANPTAPPTLKRSLTSRQQRIITALTENKRGELSFKLREIMILRRRGFNIFCKLEPFVTKDGLQSKIGRYRQVSRKFERIGGEL